MFKYTKTTLQKLETVFEEIGYKVRYEKGSFQSGYCVVENRKIAVINRFFDTEARINVLLEILGTVKEEIQEEELTEKTLDFYKKISEQFLKEEETEEVE
ncbi:MAG: hypothetical protein AAF573_11285 [Bacteroidota bacterium]